MLLFINITAGRPHPPHIIIDDVCLNDFTVSWNNLSNPLCDPVSYNATITSELFLKQFTIITMDLSYNFTGLHANTSYIVSVFGISSEGNGKSYRTAVTTVEPQSKLFVYKLQIILHIHALSHVDRYVQLCIAKNN